MSFRILQVTCVLVSSRFAYFYLDCEEDKHIKRQVGFVERGRIWVSGVGHLGS